MSIGDFSPAIVVELNYEGGLVNHPKDPGGITDWGVTIPALTEFLGRPATADEIRALTRPSAAAVYDKLYCPAVSFNQLTPGVDLSCLDCAINMGRGRAAQFMQEVAGVGVDRVVGPATLAAIAAIPAAEFIERMRSRRATWYRGLLTYADFGHGWDRRNAGVALTATAWAAKAAKQAA